MHRKTLFGLISLVILLTWLVSPIAAFAQDVTPSDAPTDVPTETVPVTDVLPTDIPTDVPAVVATDIVPIDVAPIDGTPIITVVLTDTVAPVPDPTVSLVDVTNAVVNAAASVSSGDPSGFLGIALIGCDLVGGGTGNAGIGAAFHFKAVEGSIPDGYCVYNPVTNSVEASWVSPLQAAVNYAAGGSTVTIESGTAYDENITIDSSSLLSTLVGDGTGINPIINGWMEITGVNGLWIGNLTINGWVGVKGSTNVTLDHVAINQSSDSDAVSINGSTDVTVTNSTINKSGSGNAINVSDSSNVDLGYNYINPLSTTLSALISTPIDVETSMDWGINATNVTDLSIYGGEIHADNGSMGGISVTNSSGYLNIGGDGTQLGEFAHGEGLLVDMFNPGEWKHGHRCFRWNSGFWHRRSFISK